MKLIGSAILLLAACGDDQGAVDAEPGPCWPLDAVSGGSVELGTGEIAFESMGATLAIIKNLSQSDPHLRLHARIRGMPPGDPDDFFDPRNPKTKVSAVIEEVGLTLGNECPASLGYVESTEPEAYDMVRSLRLGFGLYDITQVSGKQARITIEVVGSNKRYARDEKVVVLMTPP